MHLGNGASNHELDSEMAGVLPERHTLGITVTVSPDITVISATAVAIATQAVAENTYNAALLTQAVVVP